MSGKSTLLRAIGVNCVLAQMGAPICGARLCLPPLTVASSMRVQDSLSQGVSFFMAELRGLKAVVDLANQAQQAAGRPVVYLLDEILQGTNTAERQIAARQVIRRLLDAGAIGAVSTHDLTLAAASDLSAAAVAVHFTESFSRGPAGPSMHFDYKLRSVPYQVKADGDCRSGMKGNGSQAPRYRAGLLAGAASRVGTCRHMEVVN
jgi:DNA mismatch repair ATPase MutS